MTQNATHMRATMWTGHTTTKLRGQGRVPDIFQEKKVPLRDIAAEQQLLGTGFACRDDIMAHLPQFTPDRRADVLLVLGQSVFSDVGYLAFNIDIIHRTCEPAYLAQAYSSYEDKSYMLVRVNLFGLEFFTDYQVGVIIYKRRVIE